MKRPPPVPHALAPMLATQVVTGTKRIATIERRVSARPPGAVYADYPQNIRGKTVASVYSLRAGPDATVSTPLRREELDDELHPRDLTLDSVLPRRRDVGDLLDAGLRGCAR